jgi:hypothetical protein
MSILGAFAKLRNVTISFVMSVCLSLCLSRCLSVRIEQLDFHRTECHEMLTFEIFSKNLSRKVKFHYNLTRIMDTLHEDLCTFLAGFFLECEIFQTFVENIKTHILRSINFFPKIVPFFLDNVEKIGRARQAQGDNIIRRMRFACWIIKATDTHWEYVIMFAFTPQQWLRERASLLLYTYTACRVSVLI